jgi:hypothetical protein
MARDIVITKTEKALDGVITLSCVLWLTTPASLVKADAARTSLASTIGTNPTTQAELDAIKAGTITEQAYTVTTPPGTTANAVGALLLAAFNAAQTTLNGRALAHEYTGSYHDSAAGWTVL